jgi:hypothetical protein
MLTLESIMLYAAIVVVVAAPSAILFVLLGWRNDPEKKREQWIRDTGSPHSAENAQRH